MEIITKVTQAFLAAGSFVSFWIGQDSFLIVFHAVLFLSFAVLLFAMFYFLKERTDLDRRGAFYCFAVFCFLGAAYHGSVLWPVYGFFFAVQGFIKVAYALSAVLSILLLWKLMPEALRLPTSRQLNEAYENLSDQIALRKQAQNSLREQEKHLEDLNAETGRLGEHVKRLETEKNELASLEKSLNAAAEDLERRLEEKSRESQRLALEIAEAEARMKEKEEERRRAGQLERILRAHSYDAAVIVGGEGTIRYADAALSLLTGIADPVSKNFYDLLPDEDRSTLQFLLAGMENPEDPHLVQVRLRHEDGSVRDVEIRIENHGNDPLVQGFIMHVQDITTRRRIEEQITQFPKVVQELNEVGDIHAMLEVALRRICETTGWEYGEAWVPRTDGKVLECSPAVYADDSFHDFRELSVELRIPPEAGMAGRLWTTGEPEWAEDVTRDSGHEIFRLNAAQTAGIRSSFGVPVGMRNEVLAVMLFFSRNLMKEDPRVLDWVMSLGAHMASVIERKRAEEKLRGAETEAEAKAAEKTRELSLENENLRQELKDRKLVEDSLRKSQAKNLALVNSIEGIVYEYDLRTSRYTFVSEQAQKLLGYPVESWLSEPAFWYEHIHGGDRDRALKFRSGAAERKTDERLEYRMITAAGKTVWLRDMATVVAEDNVSVKLRGVMVDITDRKLMEEALNQERNFASTVLDTAGALVMILDMDGNIVRFNRACERISRCPSSEVMGRPFWNFFLVTEEAERIRTIFARLLAGQFPMHYESNWVAKDGTRRNIAWTSTVIYSADGTVKHVVATGLDITRRKEIEQQLTKAVSELAASNRELDKYSRELKEANERLKKMDEIKSHFISAASHELKTPLTSLKGYVETILQGEAGPVNERQSEFLGYVKESTDRLHRLLNELLDISKIESGQVAMNLEPVNIRNLLREEMMIFKPQADEKKITLGIEVSEGLKTVICDSDKMREVMDNLLSNAIKYTPRKGKINIYARKVAGRVHLEVEDTGIGIRPEDLDRIFEPFQFIEKKGMEAQEDSTGLGLTLVKRIVEAHGGTVLVKSEPQKGSVFTVILPDSEDAQETSQRHWAVTHE